MIVYQNKHFLNDILIFILVLLKSYNYWWHILGVNLCDKILETFNKKYKTPYDGVNLCDKY